MGALIDASVLIAIERGLLDLEQLPHAAVDMDIAISAVTASELLHGIHRATRGRIRSQREAFVERLLDAWPVIPFDLIAARIHAKIWAQLLAKGISIGAYDLMIGATAIANGLQVVTRDMRSFPRIPGLKVHRW